MVAGKRGQSMEDLLEKISQVALVQLDRMGRDRSGPERALGWNRFDQPPSVSVVKLFQIDRVVLPVLKSAVNQYVRVAMHKDTEQTIVDVTLAGDHTLAVQYDANAKQTLPSNASL